MKFDKIVNTILEGQAVKDNRYTLVTPFDYDNVLMQQPLEDKQDRTYYELYKVTEDKKRSIGDYRANNLEFIKAEYLAELTEDVESNWDKKYLAYGRDIVKSNAVLSASLLGVDTGSIYIVNDTRKFDDDDLTIAYLKPSSITDEVKDTFSDMYSEL